MISSFSSRRISACLKGAFVVVGAFAAGGNPVLRTYKDAALIAISTDGELILARRNPKRVEGCPQPYCLADVLEVYQAKTGKSLGQLVSRGNRRFSPAGFSHDHTVVAVERGTTLDAVTIEWELNSGHHFETTLAVQKDIVPFCLFDETSVLAGSRDSALYRLPIGDSPEKLQMLQLPELPLSPSLFAVSSQMAGNCTTRRSQDWYLMEGGGASASLYWVSIHPETGARFCHAFEAEKLRDYVVSPDRALIAVATAAPNRPSEAGKVHPEQPLWLTLLKADGCTVLHRFQLEFPEKERLRSALIGSNQYFDNAHFVDQFPAHMAISPDQTMLAIAYGVYRSPSGYAYFGLYSLADGHRLATLAGDVLHKWLWSGFMNDEIFAQQALIHGVIQFSQDSRTLYGSSEHLRQWDISGLR